MRRDYKRISTPPGGYWLLVGFVLLVLCTTVIVLATHWW